MDPPKKKKKPINPHLDFIGERSLHNKYLTKKLIEVNEKISELEINEKIISKHKIYNTSEEVLNGEESFEELKRVIASSKKDAAPTQVELLKAKIKALKDQLAREQQSGFLKAHERAQSDAQYYGQKASQLEREQEALRCAAKEAQKKARALQTQVDAMNALKKDREVLQARLAEAESRVQELEDERAHREREGAPNFGNNRPRSLE